VNIEPLIRELVALPVETDWVEFKLNNANFEEQPAKTDLTMQEAFKLLDYVFLF
jgi:hypothetical protein